MISREHLNNLELAYRIQQAFSSIGVCVPDIYINHAQAVVTLQGQPDLYKALRRVFDDWAREVENAHD